MYHVVQDGDVFETGMTRQGAADYLASIADSMEQDVRSIREAVRVLSSAEAQYANVEGNYIALVVEREDV